MLIGLVEWRYNELTGQAVIDSGMAEQRQRWGRLLEKLEKIAEGR